MPNGMNLEQVPGTVITSNGAEAVEKVKLSMAEGGRRFDSILMDFGEFAWFFLRKLQWQ